MRMTRVLKTMAILAIFTATAAAQVKNVAVVETDVDAASGASAEITSADVRQVTAELRREAVKNLPSDKYNIMTSETVQAQGSAVLEECAEENCVIALGSRIGADYIVRGTISKLRTRFTLTVEVYETENGNLVASSTPVRSETIEDLVEKAEAACVEMFGKFVSTQGSKQKPRTRYTLDVSADPAVGGTVLRSPKRDEYTSGEVVNVVAVPANGYAFTGWLGASTDKTNSVTVTMNANKVLMAKFALQSGTAQSAESTEAAESAAAPPEIAVMTADGKSSKPKRMSRGVGVYYTNKFGSGFAFEPSKEALSMPYSGGGAYYFWERKYIGIQASLIYGSGRWESAAVSNPNDLPDMDRVGISAGYYFKVPVDLKLPSVNSNLTIYPLLGIDADMTYNSVYKHGDASETYEDISTLSEAVGYLLGGGIDYYFREKIYLRFEALYNWWMDMYESFMKSNMRSNGDNHYSDKLDNTDALKIGEGFTLRLSVGFRY